MTRDDRVTEVLAAFRERAERGEDVDADAVAREHPDIADELRRRFAAERRAREMFRGDAPTNPTSLAGRALGPYRLGDVLGSGGMGTVYLATVESRTAGLAVGDVVAVKVVHPHLLHREGFFKRFLREAEMGRRLRHANVVRTLDADAVPDDGGHVHFLVMEYVEGQTLRALLDEVGKVPEELCRHVGREAAKALAAIHAEGVVHRDLKPENVLITKENVVKVMDLGVARLDDDALRVSQTGAFVGSVRYAAPEQFRGRNAAVDGRADLYALGLTLYELATGRHPFDGDDFHDVLRRQLNETPRPAGEVNPQLSPFFEELLRTLLAKDPAQRLASAADLRAALDDGDRSTWWRTRAVEVRAATHRPLRRVRIPRETALYGRDAELERLRALFDKARSGDGRIVLVEGEAGIGKSRLVDEFVGALQREGEDLDFLFGSYPPGGAATASGAFSTAYREHFGDADLESALKEALPQTPLLVPAFAALLRGDATPAGAEPLTKDSLQTVFVHATRSVAAKRPTIVLIDDLHFATDEGRALFMSLALAVPGHRILLVGTARPGVPESWTSSLDRLGHASRLPLPRLGPKDLARLLVDAFRSERLAEELSFKIAAKSDGNPYFVFEILRGLREGQFLTQKPDGTWVTTQILHDIQIPSTIRDLVAARVADLAPEDKDLLDVASCVGFEFDAGVVAEALGEARVPVLRRLARIEAKHRLVRSAGERFVFDHHQVQESLYAGLPPPLAREYHAAIASAIETRSGAASKDPKDVEGAVCVELAEHFLRGGEGARALRYLDRGFTHLETNYLHDAAVRLADCVLALRGLVAGRERAAILLRKAQRLELLGRRDTERDALEEAIAIADAAGDPSLRSATRVQLGRLLLWTHRLVDAQNVLTVALDLARLARDQKCEARATGDLGMVAHYLRRHSQAQAQLERSMSLAREIGDRHAEGAAAGNLGLILQDTGRYLEAQAWQQRSSALAREAVNRRGDAIATINLGITLKELGRFADAQEHYERSLSLAKEIGDRRAQMMAIGNLGILFEALDRVSDALTRHEESLAMAREIGDRRIQCIALSSIGDACVELGDLPRARRLIDEQLSMSRDLGDRSMESRCRYSLAAIADQEGDFEGALLLADQSLSMRRDMQDSVGVVIALIQVALLRRRIGDTAGATDAAVQALESSTAQRRVAKVAECLALLACLPGGDVAAAESALSGAGKSGDTLGVRFLLWQATHDPAHLAEAKRRLDFLVEHAPPEYRESMLTNVRLHREIVAAAREHLPV